MNLELGIGTLVWFFLMMFGLVVGLISPFGYALAVICLAMVIYRIWLSRRPPALHIMNNGKLERTKDKSEGRQGGKP